VECWRLEKEKFQEVLAGRPEMAEGISHVLATRAVNLEAAREGLSEEARHRRLSDEHSSILGRIREFFALT
jgi:CRP-like cAMP-binding protein